MGVQLTNEFYRKGNTRRARAQADGGQKRRRRRRRQR